MIFKPRAFLIGEFDTLPICKTMETMEIAELRRFLSYLKSYEYF